MKAHTVFEQTTLTFLYLPGYIHISIGVLSNEGAFASDEEKKGYKFVNRPTLDYSAFQLNSKFQTKFLHNAVRKDRRIHLYANRQSKFEELMFFQLW